MDKQADNQTAPATDDQELANVLAGMNSQNNGQTPDDASAAKSAESSEASDNTQTDEPTATTDQITGSSDDTADAMGMTFEATGSEGSLPQPQGEPELNPAPVMPAPAATPQLPPELESIKKEAVSELRPLVDKLDQPADEKFDTLLLIIRSTDDQSLLGAAHDTAKQIEDEAKRASALLDVIKEVDYFAGQTEQPKLS